MSTPAVISIGNFDGVHVGHAALLKRAREIASGPAGRKNRPEAYTTVAMTFDPHPLTVLRPEAAPARLTSFERKSALLRAAGADEVVRLMPDAATLGLTPEQFVERVVREHAPVAFVEGPTFRFGHDRAGDTRTLADLGRKFGFTVEVVAPVEIALTDATVAPATSSLARWLLAQGRVRDAAGVLGRPHAIEGDVVRGERRGRAIGFPTANIRTECLVPGDGVYAGVAELPDRRRITAAISVGTKPTFGDGERAVEAYLLGEGIEASRHRGIQQKGDEVAGLPEYGWRITLEFLGWVRDQVRFASVEALVEQIGRDCDRVKEIVAGAREAAGCR